MRFEVLTHSADAPLSRRGRIETSHGTIETPSFMHVGTFGAVRFLDWDDLERAGVQIILGNSYHLFLRPGIEIIRQIGGYHRLTGWKKPILTDSGGFQVFSLPTQRLITEEGALFKSYVDGRERQLSPENIVEFQEALGSDIMMPLDVCVPSTSSREVVTNAMNRTHRWLQRAQRSRRMSESCALFGIVQGSVFKDLRTESAEFVTNVAGLDGFSIGGLAVGESFSVRNEMTAFTANLLPTSKPRYLMGVGTPLDCVEAVHSGVDMFDCIIPTNHGKQGLAYTWSGKVHLRRQVFQTDQNPIDPNCPCPTCARYTRAYLYQLHRCAEPSAARLISLHNVFFYEELFQRMRESIVQGTFHKSVLIPIRHAYSENEYTG